MLQCMYLRESLALLSILYSSVQECEHVFDVLCRTVLTAVFGGMRAINDIRHGAPIGFKPFCE